MRKSQRFLVYMPSRLGNVKDVDEVELRGAARIVLLDHEKCVIRREDGEPDGGIVAQRIVFKLFSVLYRELDTDVMKYESCGGEVPQIINLLPHSPM